MPETPRASALPVRIVVIAGVARDGTIGADGGLPWHYTEDMRQYKRRTMGGVMLFGRKTMESIGRLLPGRTTLVLSRQPREMEARWPGAGGVATLEGAAAMARSLGADELIVGGGAVVYAMALPVADEVLLTEIPEDGGGDVFFPAWSKDAWEEVSREQVERVQVVRYLRRGPRDTPKPAN